MYFIIKFRIRDKLRPYYQSVIHNYTSIWENIVNWMVIPSYYVVDASSSFHESCSREVEVKKYDSPSLDLGCNRHRKPMMAWEDPLEFYHKHTHKERTK